MPLAVLLAVVAALAPPARALAQDTTPPDPPCRLFGTFVDEDGAPIANVTLNLLGWPANAARVRRFGAPQGGQQPAPFSADDEGRFSFSMVPPRAFQFLLEASAPGFGGVAWRWNELEPGQERDLGAVTLQREAVLVGNILDARGNLLVEGWLVTAWHGAVAGPGGRTTASARSFVDPATGQFRIAGLPPGEWHVDAHRGSAQGGSAHIEEVRVKTKQGDETFLELHHLSTDPRRQLFVTIDTHPFFPFGVALEAPHAVAPDGTRFALTPMPGSINDWHVPDIEPGTYRVEVRDPRFVDWTKEVVRTGLTHRAHLVGNAALRVTVFDGATGAEIEAYDLAVGYRSASDMEFQVRERTLPSPIGGLYTGIVPGELWVAVEAEGWPPARVEVGVLAPAETRDVAVTLVEGMVLKGRVVDTAGRPVAGIDVQVTRGEFPGDNRASGRDVEPSGAGIGNQLKTTTGHRDGETTTAADGSFTFDGLGPGTHSLLARRGPWNEVWATIELPRAEALDLTLSEAFPTAIRLQLPEGDSAEGLMLRRTRRKGEHSDVTRVARSALYDDMWICDADGVFAARDLPLGVHRFALHRKERIDSGNVIDWLIELDLTLTEPAATEQVLDLRETFPVRVTLCTPLIAVQPSELWTLHVELFGGRRPGQKSSRSSRGPDGRTLHTQWRVPGEYRVVVSAPGLRWSPSEPLHVVRGAPNVFEIEVPLAGREVRVLGEDGAPLANTVVAYWTDAMQRAVGMTDADGVLAVVLLEGTLSLALPPRQDPGIGSFFLIGLTARATAAFGPGEGRLELRFGPE